MRDGEREEMGLDCVHILFDGVYYLQFHWDVILLTTLFKHTLSGEEGESMVTGPNLCFHSERLRVRNPLDSELLETLLAYSDILCKRNCFGTQMKFNG